MSQTNPPEPPPIRQNDQAPEYYVDGAASIDILSSNVHITFSTLRYDHMQKPPTLQRHVSLRVVMPLNALCDLQNTINGLLAMLQSQGAVLPTNPPPERLQ